MKKYCTVMLAIILLCSLTFSISAGSSESLTEDTYFERLYDELPEEVEEFIPEDAVKDTMSVSGITSLMEFFFNRVLKSFLTLCSEMCLVVIFASLCRRVISSFSVHDTLWQIISPLLLSTTLFTKLLTLTERALVYCEKTQVFMNTANVIMGSILVLGGNTLSSAGLMATFSAISAALEKGCYALLFPAVRLSMASTVSGVFSKELSSIGRIARSCFHSLIGVISFFSVLIMTYQGILTQAEDSLAGKTLRFAISGSVPIVGGAVGDSISTLTSSVNVMRSSVWTLGVLSVMILALYPLSELSVFKFAVFLAKEFSEALGATTENQLLCETLKLINMIIAVVISVSLLYIFALSLFMLLPLAITS